MLVKFNSKEYPDPIINRDLVSVRSFLNDVRCDVELREAVEKLDRELKSSWHPTSRRKMIVEGLLRVLGMTGFNVNEVYGPDVTWYHSIKIGQPSVDRVLDHVEYSIPGIRWVLANY